MTFRPSPGFTPQVTPEGTPEVARILPFCIVSKSKRDLLEAMGIRDDNEKHLREAYIRPALEAGMLERAIPDKPQSSKQQYRLTAAGHEWIRQHRVE